MSETGSTRKKARSPSYPAIDLGTAMEHAQKFYDAQGRNPVVVDAAYDALGYKGKSGASATALAALIKYGLMEYVSSGKSRRVALTERGLRLCIIDASPDHADERSKLLREAALTPKVFRKRTAVARCM